MTEGGQSRTQERLDFSDSQRIQLLERDMDEMERDIKAIRGLMRSLLTTSISTLASLLVGCILLIIDISLRLRS